MGKITERGIRHEEKLVELKALARTFFKKWPQSYPHNKAKCQLPPHPACIQVLERPPTVMPTEDMGPITQRTTFSMQSVAIDVELLLGDRPKYECMEDCRRVIRQIK